MKYFMVIAKCGHVGKNNYYKGTLFFKAENAKDAAKRARECPRVKHDQKEAILSVKEIDNDFFEAGRKQHNANHYFTCVTVQEQRMYLSEIEDNIFQEEWVYNEPRKNAKKHSLRKTYNMDPDYESYVKNKRNIDYYAA